MAKKQTSETSEATAPKMVTVRALCHLNEFNTHRKKGEVFEMPAERAAVLPELVEMVEAGETQG